MPILDSIMRGAIDVFADSGGESSAGNLDGRYVGEWIKGNYSSGIQINVDSVKRIGAAQACVSIINRNVAQMPRKLIASIGDSKQVAYDHPEYALLNSRPNDRQTSFEFFQQMQGWFEFQGNAYARKVMNRRGETQQLKPMHPSRVTPEVLSNDRMRYRYQNPLTNQTEVLVQDEVFHLRNWSDDGYVGQSTIAMGSDVFGVALAAQDYTARFFQNDAKPSLYFQRKEGGPTFKTDEDKESFIERWRKGNSGANRHRPAILPFGLEIKEFGVKPSDSQLLDARKFSRIEICSLFGVPPHLIGETEKAATYASVEQFNIMFATQCLLPRVIVWEQAWQRDILQDDKFQAKFSMAALLRGDNASRTASYAVAIQNGWLNQDDVRMLEDLDPIPNGHGKTYWRPLAWAPLGQIAAPPPSGGNAGANKDPSELQDGSAAAIVHNVHALAAMAGKAPSEATKLLLSMAQRGVLDAAQQLLEAA